MLLGEPRISYRVRRREFRLCVTVGAALSTMQLIACANNAPPAKISACVIESIPKDGNFVLSRRWVVTNTSNREIDATSTGMGTPPDDALPDKSPGLAVWDDEVPLLPGKSRVVETRSTTPIAQRRYPTPTRFPCKLVAVRYSDGLLWVARPGFAAPVSREHKSP